MNTTILIIIFIILLLGSAVAGFFYMQSQNATVTTTTVYADTDGIAPIAATTTTAPVDPCDQFPGTSTGTPVECIKKWYASNGCNNSDWINNEAGGNFFQSITKNDVLDNIRYRSSVTDKTHPDYIHCHI